MATRSRIAIENQDGSVTSIYCHFDGYPEGVGEKLILHYDTEEKVKALIALGDLSHLTSELSPAPGVIHNFNNPVFSVTIAYHRDRGEDFNQEHHTNAEEFFNGDVEDFGYLFQNGEWSFVDGYGEREPRSVAALLSGLI
jgi:hypothetical protein